MNEGDRFLLLGTGGAGGRMVDRVARATGGRLQAAALDTDFAAVAKLGYCQQYRFGSNRFDGYGTGGNATLAQMAAEEEIELLRKLFADVKIAIVVAGLGGGTGSGITPVALRAARELNVRTLTFATMPFTFEGAERRALAKRACPALDEAGDVVVVMENDALCSDGHERPLDEALHEAGATLAAGMTLLWRMTSTPGYISLDFSTLADILQFGRGRAWFGFATASGEQRVEEAIGQLLDHPQRGIRRHMPQSPALLAGIIGDESLRLKEVGDTMARLQMEVVADCDVRMGTVQEKNASGELSVATLLFRSWQPAMEGAVPLRPAEPAFIPGDMPPSPKNVARPVSRKKRGKRSEPATLANDRFQKIHATLYEGEDLDVPTWQRRGLRIDAS